ncbi:P-loop containing nucleoside triphosphate hydrolases superfamily protein [Tasmannia lanceolata]|uniref:P-loop containing nucleoside triphosphate hydrolases superfamily protein n=1 Tax=Tasmannia lanceolata TaxID=3420 RepID=UPI00406379A8
MLLFRKISPSRLKHIIPLFFTHSFTPPATLFSPLHDFSLKPYQNPTPKSLQNFSSSSAQTKPSPNFRSDGDHDENSADLIVCPGCGVYMQNSDPKIPGFFIKPSQKDPNYHALIDRNPIAEESEISNYLKTGELQELDPSPNPNPNPNFTKKPIVCTRCHSLRHYGKVKDPTVENLLPDFDFDHTIGRKLVTASGTRSVVLMVVDAADFDGSFPKKVAKLVSNTIDENSAAWKEGKPGNVPRVVLVVTKIDLLPQSISPTRLEHWVRQRAREGGANKLTSVHMVSAIRDWGLKNLVDDVQELAGLRGNVWAIGAQNAGKSTLINSMGKYVGGKVIHLTEAPVPGTTLGIIRVEGVLKGQVKLFDTPGILHPYQISTRLTRDEQKLVHISKEVKPRTYRIKAGYSVHIAGLVRLDVEKSSVDSIYLTVWASPYLPLHMGKTENASMMLEAHFGRQLQPPIGEKRVAELGEWVRREFNVCGNRWDVSSMDVAVAGLGWFAIGLKGETVLGVWSYDGVDITLRNSLIPYKAPVFEETGFTVSKIVSKADSASNKVHQHKKDKKKSEVEERLFTAASTFTFNTDTGA